jgi:cyclophilin family peptidyl-prolyl cis-trans isomerase/vancomycin permeability regulator SanA
MSSLDAVVVLGCRVERGGALSGAAERRVERAALAYHEGVAPLLIASGGKCWYGVSEARAFRTRLAELGVPEQQVLLELESHNTRQNARCSTLLAQKSGLSRLGIVTCDWHMPRALADFRHFGVEATALPAQAPAARRQRAAEHVRRVLDRIVLRLADGAKHVPLFLLLLAIVTLGVGCQRAAGLNPGENGSGAPKASASAPDKALAAVLAAEQTRRADQIPGEALTAPDRELRTAAARALSRCPDAGVERLLPLLADEAATVVAAVAFGLGRACAGREGEVTRALTLRAANWLAEPKPAFETNPALPALAQALGRCAGDDSERSLRSWLALPGPIAEASAFALGQLGARRGRLDDASFIALLDALQRKESPVDSALAAFARLSPPPGAVLERVIELATAELGRSGERRVFAIRALGRAGAVAPLANALGESDLLPGERAEISRELARHGRAGQNALAALLPRLVPSSEDERQKLLERPELIALLALLDALDTRPEAAKEPLLALARLPLPVASDIAKRRHAALLRCAAARLLAAGSITNPELLACDPDPNGRIGKLSLLFVLDQGKLEGPRGQRYAALCRDDDPVVRQTALRQIPAHRELRDPAALLGDALAQSAVGTVATAAEILSAHPDRVDTSKKGADTPLIEALSSAYRKAASTDNIGVRTALIDAVAALGVLGLMNELGKACDSDNPSLREHAERALRALGQPGRRCTAPSAPASAPSELGHLARGKTKLVFSTDAGELRLELDASEAPVAVTRVLDLVSQGFYDGTSVHRVVPGFIAQLGDRGGDGYGGAPAPPLRSELSPIPFEPGDVGMAQGGLGTASSQFFVTLGRFPHLDGESAYIGHAGPGWERLLPFDRILKVRIEK